MLPHSKREVVIIILNPTTIVDPFLNFGGIPPLLPSMKFLPHFILREEDWIIDLAIINFRRTPANPLLLAVDEDGFIQLPLPLLLPFFRGSQLLLRLLYLALFLLCHLSSHHNISILILNPIVNPDCVYSSRASDDGSE
jgi:hypothetical protein